ncbi:transposon ty3-I gag-pol polyprotein [Tanacetum coccineum]
MDIPEDSQVKYVAYKLRGAASSWWDNLQTGRQRQRKQPIRTWRKMKRVMFACFIQVDYEQTLYSLYQNCRQYSRTISEYAEEFMRLASRNQLSKSDAQQVARFNNGLCYDIQAIICEKTQPPSSKEAAVNVIEQGELYEEESENEECFIRPKDVLDKEEDDEHEAYSYVINQDIVNVIIDGGSSKNIISRDIVSRLKLAPQKHPTPYKIGWIKAVGEVRVTNVKFQSLWGDTQREGKHLHVFKGWLCPFSSEDQPKATKEKASTILLFSREAFLAEVRHAQAIFAIVVKGDNRIMENVPPKLHDLLFDFKNIMPEQLLDGLPSLRDIQHQIDFGMVEELLRKGVIQESKSPCAVPALLVPMKDKTWRMYSPKLIFVPGDEWKTTFKIKEGLYEWLVMPYGLSNAPSMFMRLLNQVLKPFIGKFLVVYFDDILIYSNTEDEHLNHLQEVLKVLQEHQLFVNLKKCSFMMHKLLFLGFMVSVDGIHVDDEKIKVIQE